MWYRRIVEVSEVDLPHPIRGKPELLQVRFGKPSFGSIDFATRPKHKLEADDEEDDYTRFKRIRLVSKCRTYRAPKCFTDARKQFTFDMLGTSDGPTSSYRAASITRTGKKGNKNFHSSDAMASHFQGLLHEDSLELARSKQNKTKEGLSKFMRNMTRGRPCTEMLGSATYQIIADQLSQLSAISSTDPKLPYLIQASLTRHSPYSDDVLANFLPAPDISSRFLPEPRKYNCICNADEYLHCDAVCCEQCGTWQHYSCYYHQGTSILKHRCARDTCPSYAWYQELARINSRSTIVISEGSSSDLQLASLKASVDMRDRALKIILAILQIFQLPLEVSRWELHFREASCDPRKLNSVEMPLLEISQLECQPRFSGLGLELRRPCRMLPQFVFGTIQCYNADCMRSRPGNGFCWMEDLRQHWCG